MPPTDETPHPELRPVLVLHLPVPMELLVDVQQAFLRAYPEAGAMVASDVIRTEGDVVTFLAPPDRLGA